MDDDDDDLLYACLADFSQRLKTGEGPVPADYEARLGGKYAEFREMLALEGAFKDALEPDGLMPPVSEEAEPPARIGRYDIRGELGRGGMGRVYLAQDPRLEREVAIKLLTPEYAADAQRLERFQREARAASALNHPHICTVHDIGEEAGSHFIVMERIEGTDLSPRGGERPPLDRVWRIGGQIARALQAAHAAGIVHRDIKPSNVMVRGDGYVKVVDFGLARAVPGPGSEAEAEDLTEAGTLVGTVRYMSPEQARGKPVDGASDVFSLGVVLYELATGAHPFHGASRAEVFQALLSHTPPPADRIAPDVPARVSGLLQRMLNHEPPLRPSAAQVAEELEGAERSSPAEGAGLAREAALRHTVGRQHEMAQLLRAYDEAAEGHGRFLCVTGEPGIGKTTLIESFLAELRASGRASTVARGRCSERLAGTEAYLPVLEALDSLLHGEGGDSAARTMKALAPSWYAELAPVAGDDSSLTRALEEGGGVSQERLKREWGALALELSRDQPLVIVFDDIHWADVSTVDLLAYLAAHFEDRRILIVLSYRPTDLALAKHPFGALQLDLQARGLCHELPVGFLDREDVAQYLELEFPGNDFPAELGELIHARTEGSPLFMADLLRYLRDRDVLVREDDRWTMGRSIPDLADELPESVRSMVQRKIEQLGEEHRRLLVAASVQGYEFDSVTVAEALELDAADVEDRLAELDRVHTFVAEIEERELPDRTLTLRYRFVHVLYQNALYGTLRPTRRGQLSKSVALAMLGHHGEEDPHVAAELALLFENAREFERATYYFLIAARQAVRVFANFEAVALARRGLDLVESLPPSEERDRRELALLLTLGPPLKDTKGWGVPEVVAAYTRAIELGERIESSPDLFPALWGMWLSYSSTADAGRLRSMGQRLLRIAEESGDDGFLLQAHHALTTTGYVAGDFKMSLRHADLGHSLYDPKAHADHAFIYAGHDPGSCCASFASQSLWKLGYPEQGLERMRMAVRISEERGHPVSLALCHYSASVLQQHCQDVPAAREHALACQRLNAEQRAPLYPAVVLAWAEAQEGDREAGLARMRAELANKERIPIWWQVYFHYLVAQVLAKDGRFDEALDEIARCYEVLGDLQLGSDIAEIYRLEGVLLHAVTPSRPDEAERAIHRAIEQARSQEARMVELRAVVSLWHLRAATGRTDEVRPMLAELYGWFTEGFEMADLKEARALLES